VLTKDKEFYAEVEQAILKYEFDRIEFRYLENLQEIKRKGKSENEIQDVNKLIDALKIEIDSDKQKLQKKQDLFDKNKNAIKELEILESRLENLQNKMSDMRKRI